MVELAISPETATLFLTITPIFLALTQKQRLAILERDNHQSQIRHYSEEKGWHTEPKCEDCRGVCRLEVHHIIPQLWAIAKLHLNWDEIDTPENVITTNSCEHVGRIARGVYANPDKSFVIHPDTLTAYKNYNGNGSFEKMLEDRQVKIKEGEIYWSDDHDIEMKQTAEERTVLAQGKGWRWPKKLGR